MAKRRGRKSRAKKRAVTPCHRTIRLDLQHNQTQVNANGYYEDFHYVDLAQQLSAINSRLYRQGMYYHIGNITVHDMQGDSYVKFCTVPNTWGFKRSWQIAFKNWLNMNAQLPDEVLSAAVHQAKWNDFRVYANEDHLDDPDIPMFTDIEGNTIIQNEYKYSKYTSFDGGTPDEFYAHIMGEHDGIAGSYTSIGIMAAYDEIRKLTQAGAGAVDQSLEGGVWTNLMEREGGFDDLVTDLQQDYDYPPYSRDTLPGTIEGQTNNAASPWCMRECHIAATQNTMAAVGGFTVPAGLLMIETASRNSYDEGSENVIGIQIELVPGSYKGVKAEKIGSPKLAGKKKWVVN